MKFRTQKKHVIDFIFPVALFFVFAVTALIVILLATDIYKTTTEQAQVHDSSRTSLAYISEKIRQHDTKGSISLGTLDGQDSLILKTVIGDASYTTYIYEYEGMLKELFAKDGAKLSPAAGSDIMEIGGFSMEALTDSLFQFTITTEDGTESSVTIGVRSAL